MNLENELYNGDRLSAQELNGRLCILRNQQLRSEVDPNLIEFLKQQLELWGGVEVIETYLASNDPGHGRPSGITGMDWSWLDRE